MEKRLSQKDFDILFTGQRINKDDINYKYISPFDINNDDDYVEALIHDSEQNFIQSVIVDKTDYTYEEIEGKPEIKLNTGTILRKVGYDRGRYVVKYNFLRKVAGSYQTILVDESGQTYDPSLGYHVMPDGTIMDGDSHENSTGKILQLKELKYFIQEISPSRSEVRIVAQKIKDNDYLNSFINFQTRNNLFTFKSPVKLANLPSENANNSKILHIDKSENLRPNMEGGTLFINNAFIESVIPPEPLPTAGNLTEEIDTIESDPLVIAARFIVSEEITTFYREGELDFNFYYNSFTNDGTNLNMSLDDPIPDQSQFAWQNERIIKNIIAGVDQAAKLGAKFKGGTENSPTILTLKSVSSRPQNVAFEYEWTIFGFDRDRRKKGGLAGMAGQTELFRKPVIGRTGEGDIIIQGARPGSLTHQGTDLKEITVEIYGDDMMIGVGLKISRPALGVKSSVFIANALSIENV